MNNFYLSKQSLPAIYVCLMLLFVTANYTTAQSIENVVETALQNNPQVKAQEEQHYKSKMESKAAFRETLPTLNFDASYNHVTDVAEYKIPILGNTIRMGTYDKFETGLSANYVLFSGFALQNKTKIKGQTEQLQQVGLSKIKKQTAFQVVAVYRLVQSIQLEKDILTAATERMELQLNRARSLVKNGMILPLDTLSLSIGLLDYEKKRLDLQGRLKTATQQLQNLVGTEVSVFADLPVTLLHEVPEWQPDNVAELKSIQVKQNIARSFSKLAASEYYPKIALHAAYRYGKPGVDVIQNEWMHYGVWGVGLNWNLFRGMADNLKTDAARADEKRISYLHLVVNDQLRLEYDKSLNDHEFLVKQLSVTELALKLAEEKMNIVRTNYEQGMATVTDFNTSNLELTEAQLGRSRLLLQIALKYNEIEYKSGKPINGWSLTQ